MKKVLCFVLFSVLIFTLFSCDNNLAFKHKYAALSFKSMAHAKSLEPTLAAYIDYADPDTLLWDVTMTKSDSGDTTGQGVFEDVTLADTLYGFALGSWNISMVGHDDKNKTIYTGQMETILTEGVNNIAVPVTPTGTKGNICFTNCNFDGTEVLMYSVMDNGSVLFSIPIGECTLNEDTGLYDVAETTKKVDSGIHNIQIQYGSHNKAFVLRVEPNMTTYVTYGIHEGNAALSVVIEPQEAIVE